MKMIKEIRKKIETESRERFEDRVIGDYPTRFKSPLRLPWWRNPPTKQERSRSFQGGVTFNSIYFYDKSVYQDVKLGCYFGLISSPMSLTFGFCLDVLF